MWTNLKKKLKQQKNNNPLRIVDSTGTGCLGFGGSWWSRSEVWEVKWSFERIIITIKEVLCQVST